jgi:hypothetical protein
LVGVVVVVGVVVESDSQGPDWLGFGAVCATATAPPMIRPARELMANSFRFMTFLRSADATCDTLHYFEA